MRIQRTSQLITVSVMALAALTLACALWSMHLRGLEERAYETRRESLEMAAQLAGGSDRLTTAVRGYAATGERRYFDAFQQELTVDRTRDKALDRLQQLGLAEEELALIVRAKADSDALVSLENRAMDAVARTNLTEAVALVFGEEYRRAKETITQPIAESRRLLAARTSREAHDLAARATAVGWVAIAVSLVNAAAIVGALLFFYQKRVVRPLVTLNHDLGALVTRKGDARIGYQEDTSEIGEVARSMEKYRLTVDAADRQHWVKSHVADLADSLQGTDRADEFGQRFLSMLVPWVDGGCGAFHLLNEADGRYHLCSGYGQDREDAGAGFLPGEGIAGQAALERRVIRITDLPPGYVRIASSLGAAPPRELAAVPILSQDRVLAVVEIASFTSLTDQKRTLLEESAAMASPKLEILLRNRKTQDLLEQVRTSQAQLRTLVDSIRSVIFMKDREGRHLLVNAYFEEATGISRETILGRTDFEVMPAAAAESIVSQDRTVMESARSSTFEETVPAPDGSPRHYLTTKVPLVDSEGTVYGICGIATDITERKGAERALQQANLLSDMALELTHCGYWHVDYSDPEYYYQSERAARIAGEEVKPDGRYHLQKEWFARLVEADPELAQAAAERYQGAIDGKYPSYDATYAYRRPSDGRVVFLHAAGSLVRGEDGTPRFMYGVYQDITELKRLESDLIASKVKAEEATQMKSMFLANMSHEIRTPMNAIIGLSHLALKTQLTAKQRDYVGKVHNAGTSLLAIINDILDFSKIEAGKLDIESTDFRIDDVISSVTTVTAQKAHDKGLEFLADVSSAIPEVVVGDPLRVGQILTNLVNNAVKFTENGEIRLRIEMLERTGEKVQLRFRVTDTGIGMTKEQSARLFQAFAQADMSTTRKHGGTGLGLTICRRLVELMGGQIWLESEPGVGSTFLFTLWLGVGVASAKGRMVPSQFENLRVLVVDDNSAAREILAESLEPLARRVDAVSSGPEAIAAIKERDADSPYDVVFMDWRMPGMDGLQATRLIKNDATLRKQPAVIIVTAFGREEVREEAEQLKVDGFLVKPVTKSMLVDSLVGLFVASPDQTGPPLAGAGEDSTRLAGLRILLAEDNSINQQIAVELLEGVGATVRVAGNGRIAVETLLASPEAFDLVLMDLQMPEMDGHQATTRIRGDTRFAALPIIAMTAHATMEEKQRCLADGMNDHVSKPIEPGVLFATLERHYRRPTHSPGASPPSGNANPGAGAPSGAGDLPVVEGLDTGDGLSRVAGNHRLYLKLLGQFMDQQARAPEEIAGALAGNDTPLAERVAHTVKGVAGSLGMRPVQDVAARLEKAIGSGSSPGTLAPVLEEFRGVLAAFVQRLRAAMPQSVVPPPAATPPECCDPEAVRRAVGEMITHLGNFDSAAGDCLEANRAEFQSILEPDAFSGFEQELGGFDFAGAMTRLEAAATRKGIPLK